MKSKDDIKERKHNVASGAEEAASAGSRPAGGLEDGVAGFHRGGEHGGRGEGGAGGRAPWVGQF